MILQIFKNGKGLIYGNDSKRIQCAIDGTLKIGTTETIVSAESESIMPLLFNGSNGEHKATFTSILGNVYELANVTVKGGRIVPPSQTAVELAELRYKSEILEAECEALRNEVCELRNIFDTNSLNFLIK